MTIVRATRRLPSGLWALLCVGLLVPSLIWVAEDRTVWPWDQAWYGEVSADLWFWMGHSLRRWVGELADGLSLKPPGVVWLGQLFVPLRHIFGSVEVSLLVSILVTQFVLLAILFRIGRRLSMGSSLVAVAGVTLAAGASLFAGLSHQFSSSRFQAAEAWTPSGFESDTRRFRRPLWQDPTWRGISPGSTGFTDGRGQFYNGFFPTTTNCLPITFHARGIIRYSEIRATG